MHRAKRAASLKVKRRVGKYELGRTIGEGTFAKVRFATNMETGEHVAIKIIDKAKVHKYKLVEQVHLEFSAPGLSLIFTMQRKFPRAFLLSVVSTKKTR